MKQDHAASGALGKRQVGYLNITCVLSFGWKLPAWGALLLLFSLLSPNGIYAARANRPLPYLVKDLHPGVADAFPKLDYAFPLMPVGNTLYFIADDGTAGLELWRSNVATAGITQLTNMERENGEPFTTYGSTEWTAMDGLLYFDAVNHEHEPGLWKSDGTPGGTLLVKNYEVGAGVFAYALTAVNHTLYFGLAGGAFAFALWKSDGTPAGTVPLWEGSPAWLTRVGETLYFVDGSWGQPSLWKTDGTVTGTVQIKSFRSPTPPAENFYPAWLTAFNGDLYFTAYDEAHGFELWKSDGTPAGTVLVKDLNAGANNASIQRMLAMNGLLYFSATDGHHGQALWQSDGTAAGTVLLKDITPRADDPFPAFSRFTPMNNVLYFNANDGLSGYELWRSDGTPAGTTRVKDINPGAGDALSDRGFDFLTEVNGILYFPANNGVHGIELWQSDGTAGGTLLVVDLRPGPEASRPAFLSQANGMLYFAADDSLHGMELWVLNPQLTQRLSLPLVWQEP